MMRALVIAVGGTLGGIGAGLGATAIEVFVLRLVAGRHAGGLGILEPSLKLLWIGNPSAWGIATLALVIYQIWRAGWLRSRQFEIITNTAPHYYSTVGLVWLLCGACLVGLHYKAGQSFLSVTTNILISALFTCGHLMAFLLFAVPVSVLSYFSAGGIK